MLNTLGIIQACHEPARFHSLAHRLLGGQPLLQWVIRRATDSQRLDGVIVVACENEKYRPIDDLIPADIPLFVGSGTDALDRFSKALEAYPAKAIVRIRGDSPFVDPLLVDRLITAAEAETDCDYMTFGTRDGRPAHLSSGLYAEWIRTSALRRAARSARCAEDREDVTRYLHTHDKKFNVRFIPAPIEIDRDDIRLTVDIEEDWEHTLAIVDALGTDELDWRRIAALLDHQPMLRERMAVLNREHAKN